MIQNRNIDYFQGILQLREVDQDVVDFTISQFRKNNIGIAKVKPLKNGVDIYSASNKFLRIFVRKLQKIYGGEVKESPKLFSRDRMTSKNIYRLNVLYRALPVKKGDIITRDSHIYQITSFDKEILLVLDLKTGKRKRLHYENDKAMDVYDSLVISIKPEIIVLDKDYQPIKVANPRKHKEGDMVSAVFFENKAFLV